MFKDFVVVIKILPAIKMFIWHSAHNNLAVSKLLVDLRYTYIMCKDSAVLALSVCSNSVCHGIEKPAKVIEGYAYLTCASQHVCMSYVCTYVCLNVRCRKCWSWNCFMEEI